MRADDLTGFTYPMQGSLGAAAMATGRRLT